MKITKRSSFYGDAEFRKNQKKVIAKWFEEFKNYKHMIGEDFIKPGMPFGNGTQWWATCFTNMHLSINYELLIRREIDSKPFGLKEWDAVNHPKIMETINSMFLYMYVFAALKTYSFDSKSILRLITLLNNRSCITAPFKLNPMLYLRYYFNSNSMLGKIIKLLAGGTDVEITKELYSYVMSTEVNYKDENNAGGWFNIRKDYFKQPMIDEEVFTAAYWLCVIEIVECEREINKFCE